MYISDLTFQDFVLVDTTHATSKSPHL